MDTDRAFHLTARGRLGRVALVVACCMVAALASPAVAPAKQGLTTGFAALEDYQNPSPAERSIWLQRTVDAGAGVVRLSVGWASVAGSQRPPDPTNPGSASYDFSSIDGPVRDARARGLTVLLTVNVAPVWAEGPGRPASATQGSWKPNPGDLADFLQAVAARYSGNFDPDGPGSTPPLPAAQAVEVWDEPNSSDWITPQFEGRSALSPDYYREMLNASYRAVKAVNPNMLVVAAGTDPYGDPPGGPYPPDVQRVQPVTFWQQLLCVKPVKGKTKSKAKGKKKAPKYVRVNGCARPMFDVLAHHPIDNTGGGPLKHGPLPGDASTPDLGRVVNVLRGAEKLGTVTAGRHPVWVTEFWWDSNPPNPVGASLNTQARWIEQSLYLFWKAGASAAINFEISDSTARANVHAGLQAGVYFADGRPKPSLTAFRFPFVGQRIDRRTVEAWGKAPAAGQLLIQRQQGASFVTIKKLQVTKGGVFDTTLKLRGKQRLRATVGSEQSLVWTQSAGAAKTSGGGGGPSALRIIVFAAAGLLAVGFVRRRQVVRRRRRRGRRPRPTVVV